MSWTPYQIEIMLHYHCSAGPFARISAPAFHSTVDNLISLGLLKSDGQDVPNCFDTTARGKALMEMWCSTPLPEPRFVDPRFPALSPSQAG